MTLHRALRSSVAIAFTLVGFGCESQPAPLDETALAELCTPVVLPGSASLECPNQDGLLIRSLYLTNPSSERCAYLAHFPSSGKPPQSLLLEPQSTRRLEVQLGPWTTCGADCVWMDVAHEPSATPYPEVRIQTDCRAGPPALVAPQLLVLTELRVGEVRTRTISIHNSGREPLLPGPLPELPADVEWLGALPEALEPGLSAVLELRYQPSAPRDASTVTLRLPFSMSEGRVWGRLDLELEARE